MTKQVEREGRLRIALISNEILQDVLLGRIGGIPCETDAPQDLEVLEVRSGWDLPNCGPRRGVFAVLVSSGTFDPVPAGEPIPIVRFTYKTKCGIEGGGK